MEDVIARMQDEKNGIPIRTVKSFLSKIPSVFSGNSPYICFIYTVVPIWRWESRIQQEPVPHSKPEVQHNENSARTL